MEIIFKDKYVNYSQISDVELIDINDMLIGNNIYVELGDESSNDWAGYSYYYCKSLGELDNKTISSFIYIITWFMTGNPINVPVYFQSEKYYKNDKIINECLDIYNNLYEKYDDEVELCEQLFKHIYDFYIANHGKFLKRTERISFLLTYEDWELFEKLPGESKGDKMKLLIDNYYNK